MRAGASWRQRVFLGALPSTADDARVASVSRRQIDVSVGSNSEVELADADFRFTPESGHPVGGLGCPKSANSGAGPSAIHIAGCPRSVRYSLLSSQNPGCCSGALQLRICRSRRQAHLSLDVDNLHPIRAIAHWVATGLAQLPGALVDLVDRQAVRLLTRSDEILAARIDLDAAWPRLPPQHSHLPQPPP